MTLVIGDGGVTLDGELDGDGVTQVMVVAPM